jgi:hypothetical protein
VFDIPAEWVVKCVVARMIVGLGPNPVERKDADKKGK